MSKSTIIRVRISENPHQAFCRAYYASGQVRQWKLKGVCGCLSDTDNTIPETVRQFCREHKDGLRYRENTGINPYSVWEYMERG